MPQSSERIVQMTLELEDPIRWTLPEPEKRELIGAVAELLLEVAFGETERREVGDESEAD